MIEITMTIPDQCVGSLGSTPDEAAARLRMLAAVKLFEMKDLSSGAAARLAGVCRIEFLKRLADYGVSVFDMTEEELQQAMRHA
jgi:predicted HTH domain antitoxin